MADRSSLEEVVNLALRPRCESLATIEVAQENDADQRTWLMPPPIWPQPDFGSFSCNANRSPSIRRLGLPSVDSASCFQAASVAADLRLFRLFKRTRAHRDHPLGTSETWVFRCIAFRISVEGHALSVIPQSYFSKIPSSTPLPSSAPIYTLRPLRAP